MDALPISDHMRGLVTFDRLFFPAKGELTRNLKLRRDEIERMHLDSVTEIYKEIQKGRVTLHA
jgi:long-subunit acyl-CoA synthetase (AMP-forming)